MNNEAPQKLQRDGMEREARELFDRLSDKAPIPTVLLNREQFTKPVAEALEKCTNEARLEALEQAESVIAYFFDTHRGEILKSGPVSETLVGRIRALKAEPVPPAKPAREGG